MRSNDRVARASSSWGDFQSIDLALCRAWIVCRQRGWRPARGTPIEQPEASPATGVVARMDLIGQRVTHVTEEVTARAARPFEVDALSMATGVPVLAIERTYYVDDRPVETADIIIPADRYSVYYRIPIPDH